MTKKHIHPQHAIPPEQQETPWDPPEKKPGRHLSLQELMDEGGDLSGMMEPSWGARVLKQARELKALKHVPESVKEQILRERLGKYGQDTVTYPPDRFGYRPSALYPLDEDRLSRINPHPALGDEEMERHELPIPGIQMHEGRFSPKLFPRHQQKIGIDGIPARVITKTRI